MTQKRLRLGVLISGRGSNLQALIQACATSAFPAEVALVISNVANAEGLAHASEAGIATATIDHKVFLGRAPFEDAITAALEAANVELVCLAGFMRLLTPGFVTHWHDRMINVHPSLLPAYRGLNTHERALADGVRFAGCTVHYVRADCDAGPIVAQAAVPVAADDTPDSLAARVLLAEHQIYPEAIRLIAEGQTRIVGERVIVTGASLPPSTINPKV